MAKRSPTTKDVGLLYQLYKSGQLNLSAEFQRNAVWPRPAKAYLIDTILNDRPIPLLFFQRTTSAQSGLQSYTVIDGQQRLRAIFDFLDDRFRLGKGTGKGDNKRFSKLSPELQQRIRNYDLVVEELSGYSDGDIRDMFIRMNKYVVQLSPQELRHAKNSGVFYTFVEKLGRLEFWKKHRVFSHRRMARMRSVEFAAEITILLIEGPQDKKASVDLYYQNYESRFPGARALEARIRSYLFWVEKAVPHLGTTRFRKPVDLYSLIGALDQVSDEGTKLSRVNAAYAGQQLANFENQIRTGALTAEAERYLSAASRQTDNIIPRTTRIEVLAHLIAR